ncbi:MAG TPA: RNA chaperone Hfq [Terriglobales bacterium]|jgi:sRNA-binding regulator protein Hfq|nr:RNA chaperone Hfq [Terriglobales bacterium]
MKEGTDSTAVRRAPEASEEFSNRKLIRPSLGRPETRAEAPPDRRDRPDRPAYSGKKVPPPEQTHAENFYYQKQIQSKTPMVIVLRDGEEVRGTIEWYDKNCIKVVRFSGQSNLLIYKPAIKYIYKESEDGRR